MIIDSSQRAILRSLWFNGPLSRSELHKLTGMTPNAVGNEISHLQRLGLVKELKPKTSTGGRPQIPLILDPSARRILGISIEPGLVEVAELGLSGEFLGSSVSSADFTKRVEAPDALDAKLMEMLDLLVMAFSNAVNFVRPTRLVLASRFMGGSTFADWLTGRIRQSILPHLSERVTIDAWNIRVAGSAESAAWLGLARLLLESWEGYPSTEGGTNPQVI